MARKNDDIKKIKQLIDIMKQNDLAEIQIKHGEEQIHLKRSQHTAVTHVPLTTSPVHPPTTNEHKTQQQTPPQTEEQNLLEITSPMVGTFYATPSPDSEPFVDVGSTVQPKTVICIIEAMKVMNEIKADTAGTVEKICVVNGQAVEFGQTLFKIKPE